MFAVIYQVKRIHGYINILLKGPLNFHLNFKLNFSHILLKTLKIRKIFGFLRDSLFRVIEEFLLK